MPIKTNGYFNNPQIGQAFANLAGLFDPVSGSDAAGYASANSKTQEASRLAQLFNYAQKPEGFDKNLFDRMAVATGQGSIANGYYGVDTQAATSRANNAADNAREVYGIDTTAATSRANNTDNNARALQQTGLEQSGQTTRSLLDPVQQGATRFIPPAVAEAFGLPAQQIGNIAAQPGEQITTTDGRVIAGAPKPLTETELAAQQNDQLHKSGQITDQMLVDAFLGKQPPVKTVDAAGKAHLQTPGAAARTGATPYDPGVKAETQNYQAPDGSRGAAVFDPASRQWVDTATKAPLPQGAITFNSSLQGGATDTGLGGKQTERDSVIALAGENMAPGLAILNQAYAGDKSVSPGALLTKGVFGDNPAVKDMAQRMGIINPDDQEIMGGINSVMNYLYLQTGAARTPGEDERGYSELVPLASDTPQARQLKRDMFNQKAVSIINQAKSPELRQKLMQAMQGMFVSPQLNGAPTRQLPTGTAAPAAQAPGAQAAPAAQTPAVENWVRGPNGKLQRAQ